MAAIDYLTLRSTLIYTSPSNLATIGSVYTVNTARMQTTASTMIIHSTGNVGIGTMNPRNTLHVHNSTADSTQGPDVSSTSGQIVLTNTKSGTTQYSMAIGMDQAYGCGYINAAGNGAAQFICLNARGGNVGVGTTNPSFKMDIWGPAVAGDVTRQSMLLLARPATSGVQNNVSSGFFTGANVSTVAPYGALDIRCNGLPVAGNTYGAIPDVTVMSIIGNGNVGIGITNPSSTLDVNGTAAFSSTVSVYGTTTMYGNLELQNTTFSKYGTTSGYSMNITGGSASNSPYLQFFSDGIRRCYFGNATTSNMYLYAENSTALHLGTDGATRIIINTGGNVGIGSATTYTNSRMNVVSAGTGSDTTNWIAANFGGTGANPRVVIGCLNGAATIGAHSSAVDAWANLCLAPSGNVGIGTATPQCKLHIEGTQTATLGTYANLVKGSGGVEQSTSKTVSTFSVYSSGSIWAGDIIGCANISSFSDQRIKKDIQPVHDVFDLIEKIEVVSYEHIDHRKKAVKIGVVAQQIQSFLPEVIDKAQNWIPTPYVFSTSHECHENQVTIIVDTSSPELQIGRRIRLYIEYDNKETEYDTEIINLTSSSITCKVWDAYHTNDNVFVYGVEVNDFLIVDKQQLGLLALAGVQELHKMAAVHESTISSLQSQIEMLLSQNASLQSQLASLLK